MPEPLTSEATESLPLDLPDREEWRIRLEKLPLRAIAALTIRCARRREPLLRMNNLKTEVFSSGLDGNTFSSNGKSSSHPVVPVVSVAANDTNITSDEDAATDTDLKNLLDLNLGKPGEPGEPIRWNDPRLGPLWPDGAPEWYVQAEKVCRELEDHLQNLPDTNTAPPDPLLEAQFDEWRKLDVLYNEGKLNEYRGEYVIWAEGEIFAHGRHLLNVRLQAEELAGAKGITPNQLIDYFVPGE